ASGLLYVRTIARNHHLHNRPPPRETEDLKSALKGCSGAGMCRHRGYAYRAPRSMRTRSDAGIVFLQPRQDARPCKPFSARIGIDDAQCETAIVRAAGKTRKRGRDVCAVDDAYCAVRDQPGNRETHRATMVARAVDRSGL